MASEIGSPLLNTARHLHYMREALSEAYKAYDMNEAPIGCLIVFKEKIIARARNMRVTNKNTLHHAEMLAIDQACGVLGDWRLEGCTLYVTVEPCPMCAGAIVQARIPVVVYGADNSKSGCAGSVLNILQHSGFNHRCEVVRGVMQSECAELMKAFFSAFRLEQG